MFIYMLLILFRLECREMVSNKFCLLLQQCSFMGTCTCITGTCTCTVSKDKRVKCTCIPSMDQMDMHNPHRAQLWSPMHQDVSTRTTRFGALSHPCAALLHACSTCTGAWRHVASWLDDWMPPGVTQPVVTQES